MGVAGGEGLRAAGADDVGERDADDDRQDHAQQVVQQGPGRDAARPAAKPGTCMLSRQYSRDHAGPFCWPTGHTQLVLTAPAHDFRPCANWLPMVPTVVDSPVLDHSVYRKARVVSGCPGISEVGPISGASCQ